MTQHRMVYSFYFNLLAATGLLAYFLYSFREADSPYTFRVIEIILFSITFSFLLLSPLVSNYFGMPNKKDKSIRNKLYFMFIPQRKKSIDLDLPYDFHIPIVCIIAFVIASLSWLNIDFNTGYKLASTIVLISSALVFGMSKDAILDMLWFL